MKRSNFLFACLLLLALLPVLLLRDYTPSNELRYLSIVDEALRSGHFLTFTNQGVPYADKPPLYFWLLMLGKWLLGAHYMWFLSLFSLLPALLIVGVMDHWVGGKLSDENRFTARLVLMSSGLFLGLGIILRMDMLMCLFIVLALRTFYRMYSGQGREWRNAFLFPLYLFLALFTKGPVGLLVPLFSTIVFLLLTKRFRTIGRYWGWTTWGVLLAGCTVWFVGVYLEGGAAYLNNLLFHQTVDRAVNSFHHDEPFYYYLVSVWYSLAPWSLLLIGLLVAAIRRRLVRTHLERFFLTVLVTTLVMLSCISSKIAVYLAPAFPFFVYLPLLLLPRFRWNHWLALTVALPAFLFGASLPVLLLLGAEEETAFLAQPFFYAAAVVLTLTGILSLVLLYRKRALGRAINTMAIGLFLSLFVGGWALPSINSRIGFSDVCQAALSMASDKQLSGGYVSYGISRPQSMDVFLHQPVEELTLDALLAGNHQGKVLLLSAGKLREDSSIQRLVAGKEQQQVGPYLIVSFK